MPHHLKPASVLCAGKITLHEFLDYYKDISANFTYLHISADLNDSKALPSLHHALIADIAYVCV